MRNRLGLVLVALAVAVVAVVVVVTVRIKPPPLPEPPAPAQRPGGDQAAGKPQNLQIQGAQVTQRDKQGNIIWQARTAGRFDFDEAAQTLRADDIHWELVRAGQEKLIVEAREFAAGYEVRQINFADGVRVYTESKSQLFEVSSLVYQFGTQKLIGKGPVSFRLGKYRVTGDRLVIDNRREEVRFTGPGRFARLPGL